ncbi:hypothetical protein G4Y79_20200 [Phototrophicus methaneseepsis]|uniref:N-acetyltransferase domain-containing protein n=1 Tax=Phototrophicus methaneseepsis TaxID=2710758 RepID=A0A7S8E7W2_9CHLR|nr:hypothetical protein [Phototrophicus methaneseepsis]QPC81986.1 hypothetical protein G4Y79_20200 [Phototrophicus methaneseepsis]
MRTRPATLDDTQAISALFQARISRWQRLCEDGQVQDIPYEDLTVYERWLHGGPWMSTETGAIWLSHLCHGAGVPIVLIDDQEKILGYSEAFPGREPLPLGKHLYIGDIAAADETAHNSLMQHWLNQPQPFKRLIMSVASTDSERRAGYEQYGFQPLTELYGVQVSAQQGQGFYRTEDHLNAEASQIIDMIMPVGCITSARQQWETLWPSHWDAIPQIMSQQKHRLHFSAAAQDAFVLYEQHLYDPRAATVYCWSNKPLSSQLLVAIRDWAHRAGYRSLYLTVNEKLARSIVGDDLGSPQVTIYARDA